MYMTLRFGLLIGTATFAAQMPAVAQEFEGVGNWPVVDPSSRAQNVSANGAFIVGVATGDDGPEAFRWSLSDGMIALGDLPGGAFSSIAYDVSADGRVVVGSSSIGSVFSEAFRWTPATGMVGLGDLPGGFYHSQAFGVSDDGEVIVGASSGDRFNTQAFRWTHATGMVGIGVLPGGVRTSVAAGISGDGAVIVGYSGSAGGTQAFRWTQQSGMVGLGDLAGGAFESSASDASGDGAVIVGTSESADGVEAFRWTLAGGMVGLGDLPGGHFYSSATAVSADGSTVVGVSEGEQGNEAFRWTGPQGMQSVRSLLVASGVDLGTWVLAEAAGVSADGLVVVGNGINPEGNAEAWWAKIGTGLLSSGPLQSSLQSLVVSSLVLQQLANGHLDNALIASQRSSCNRSGAARRPLCGWVSGGIRDYEGDRAVTDGAIGLSYPISSALQVGGGLNWGWRDSDLGAYGGGARSFARGGNAFVAYEPGASGARLHGAVILDHFSSEVTRGYLNGIAPETSRGTQEGWAYGAAMSTGWAFLVSDSTSVMPSVSYSISEFRIDPYNESTGSFPAAINEIKGTMEVVRFGVETRFDASRDLVLKLGIGGAHRLDAYTPNVSGQVAAIGAEFAFVGEETKTHWLEAKIAAELHLADHSQLHIDVGASSDAGTAPRLRVGIGGAMQF